MKTAKKKTPSWGKDDTHFIDCNGREIRGGQIVEYWDNEGGCGVGVVDFKEKRWQIINSWEAKQYKFKVIIAVDSFSPNHIRILGSMDSGSYTYERK